jgi:hypothetical protein
MKDNELRELLEVYHEDGEIQSFIVDEIKSSNGQIMGIYNLIDTILDTLGYERKYISPKTVIQKKEKKLTKK